jgi:hypothetical protein
MDAGHLSPVDPVSDLSDTFGWREYQLRLELAVVRVPSQEVHHRKTRG